MVKCPTCSQTLEFKSGLRKFSAQIGNPEIAIVETKNSHFCNNCNEYFLSTQEIISAITQIMNSSKEKQEIKVGIYQ